jgi:ankyrin repeat protein
MDPWACHGEYERGEEPFVAVPPPVLYVRKLALGEPSRRDLRRRPRRLRPRRLRLADVGSRDHWGDTLAHDACSVGDMSALRFLSARRSARALVVLRGARAPVRAGEVDWNARNSAGRTPLHCACGENRADAARLLLSTTSADADAADDEGDSPLHVACREGHLGAVVALLDHGADPAVRNDGGDTPLHEAARRGDARIAVALAQRSPETLRALDHWRRTPLAAYMERHGAGATEDALCSLLYGPIDDVGYQAFATAIARGWLSVLRAAHKLGADANILLEVRRDRVYPGVAKSPLCLAMECGQAEAAKLLLSHGADALTVSPGLLARCGDGPLLSSILEARRYDAKYLNCAMAAAVASADAPLRNTVIRTCAQMGALVDPELVDMQ